MTTCDIVKPCSCPAAGFCPRHAIEKSNVRWQLCQTKEKYRKAWDEHRLYGQSQEHPEREKRKREVAAKVKAASHLRKWCSLFKVGTDVGIGDTMRRLLTSCDRRRHRATKQTLREHMRLYSCGLHEATLRLNELYPYS